MKAVVLVGGQGTRLRPLTLSTAKPLLPVAEVLMIERVIMHLARHGIDGVVLSMGYQPDGFVTAFPDGRCAGVSLTYAVEPEPRDTGGGIAFAARYAGLHERGERFVVVNGDVLTDLDVTALVAFHGRTGGEATIALTPVENPAAFGLVLADDEGRVAAFIEPPDAVKKGLEVPTESPPTNLVNAGFYVFEPSVLDRIPVDIPYHLETKVFPLLVADGGLFALSSDAYWMDTGTPALFLRASLDLMTGVRPGPPAPGAKERSPGVWTIGAAVVDGAIEQPALIGDASFIASGALVENSIVGAGARVESGAHVRGSLLLPGAVVGQGAIVEDSIIGEGGVIGRDARLSELTVVQGGANVAAASTLRGEGVAA
jgi:NDP-sugar pyrophosphorylase family protein